MRCAVQTCDVLGTLSRTAFVVEVIKTWRMTSNCVITKCFSAIQVKSFQNEGIWALSTLTDL